MHYHVETNTLICLIKRLDEAHLGGIQSTSVATRNSVTLLLESSLMNIDISLTVYILQVEPAVTSRPQLINEEDIYT